MLSQTTYIETGKQLQFFWIAGAGDPFCFSDTKRQDNK